MILKNHTSAPIRKERLSSTRKARREVSRNKFMEKSGMPDGVKTFREIDSSENRPRARPGFVKLIRNELRGGRETERRGGRQGRRASDRAKERAYRFRVRFR